MTWKATRTVPNLGPPPCARNFVIWSATPCASLLETSRVEQRVIDGDEPVEPGSVAPKAAETMTRGSADTRHVRAIEFMMYLRGSVWFARTDAVWRLRPLGVRSCRVSCVCVVLREVAPDRWSGGIDSVPPLAADYGTSKTLLVTTCPP